MKETWRSLFETKALFVWWNFKTYNCALFSSFLFLSFQTKFLFPFSFYLHIFVVIYFLLGKALILYFERESERYWGLGEEGVGSYQLEVSPASMLDRFLCTSLLFFFYIFFISNFQFVLYHFYLFLLYSYGFNSWQSGQANTNWKINAYSNDKYLL